MRVSDMTAEQIAQYIRGEVPRTHAVEPHVIHGEIPAPALLVTASPRVQFHEPSGTGR